MLGQLRHSILKSLVARGCLQPETANLLESWPLERSGFSAFLGDPINHPGDRPRLQRVLNYILRPALPLKHLSYVESTGEVRYSPPRAAPKVWEHAYDCLADWVQHIPRARQHQVTYAGHFANALGNLSPKPGPTEETDKPKESKPSKWVKWRTFILRCWAIDPELSWQLLETFKRDGRKPCGSG